MAPKRKSKEIQAKPIAERQDERHQVDGRLCTPEENEACYKVVIAVSLGRMSEEEGLEKVGRILNPDIPF